MSAKLQKHVGKPVEVLSELAWRFDACPEQQLHWCDIYEHSRDNELVAAMFDHYRKCERWASPGIFPDSSAAILGKAFIDAFPEFPQKPFLALDAEVRACRCRALDQIRRHLHIYLCNDQRKHGAAEGTFLLRIHRRAPRAAIMKVIDGITQEGRGRQLPIERLRYLGLARLYKHFEHWGAVMKHMEQSGTVWQVKDESQCSKGKSKAARNVANVLMRLI